MAGSANHKDSFEPTSHTPHKMDGEDAVRGAGSDSVIGDRSPVQAMFTDIPSPTGVASPLEATVEDFKTAPSSPFDAAAPLVVSMYISTSPQDHLLSAVDDDDNDAQTPLAASPAGTRPSTPLYATAASSSGTKSALPMPTTLSCTRDVSISRLSDASHVQSMRGRQDVRKSVLLIQSSIEETDLSEKHPGAV
ncbi:hypothetical protein C2E23DRAFT_883353 [Lenzites betulinus]|nr:hypothetical protein C2E23DRAFT_883353 [Lenzites betulinus]